MHIITPRKANACKEIVGLRTTTLGIVHSHISTPGLLLTMWYLGGRSVLEVKNTATASRVPGIQANIYGVPLNVNKDTNIGPATTKFTHIVSFDQP